jgi:trehalose 6-phosphate synthase
MVVVANRLPVSRAARGGKSRWVVSPGGLVAALEPIVRERGGTWVGWTGSTGPTPRPFKVEGIGIRPVPIRAKEIETFYHGLSNRTLWPLYHDAIREPAFHRDWWWPYVDVNLRFAKAAAASARAGDLVWVHDYHLQLVPRMLRQMRPDVRIGFFLHIPFPPEELFAWLPWRTQILEGLLGADVVGFQTYANAQNFSRAARAFTRADGTDTLLEFEGRQVTVRAFPISIDAKLFEEQGGSEETLRAAREIRARIGTRRKLLLGVDRLDYTKGIDTRLHAFGEMLRKKKVTVNDCVMMQVAVPSREKVGDYARMRDIVERTVGRINGEFSEPGRVAVHYFRRSLSRRELIAYYRAADVMLVTPLRDGMNLVCKEFVATRTDNSGVLVLSEFAGAARELRRALLVNPRDIDGMAAAFQAAVTLPKEEARHRMAVLRMVVRRHDVYQWAQEFVEALSR